VTTTNHAIEVENLVKDFGRTRAVDGVSFQVPQGQLCALLGPNGAGKTTTIHILLGLMLPTSGAVRILGLDVGADRTAAVRRTNFTASYVAFSWRLKVGEVLRVFSDLYEVPDPRAAIADVVRIFRLERLLDKPVHSLSSGEQTLLGLAKSLVNRPLVLFLDEPTASLDPENAFEARRILQSVAAERRMTIFITSHNMAEIERLADRVLLLSKGRLVADASPGALRDQYSASDLEEVLLQVAREERRT